MTKRILIFALVFVCGFASVVRAQASVAKAYTPSTVPNVQLTDASRFVSNPDGIISAATETEINRMCADVRQKGLAEVVVLVLDRVDEGELDMFAHKVLNLWGVGQKGKDNGLVISVVRAQRDIQFETGYGLEGVLPDAICKRIQTVYMRDPLRAGDFDAGVLAGVRAVYNVLMDNQEELAALRGVDTPKSSNGGAIQGAMMLLFVVVMAIVIIVSARRNNRRNGGGTDYFGGPGGTGSRGDRDDAPDAGAVIGGILGGLLGGMGGGGYRGGGFGGGGFGGGGFGGGFGGGRSGGGGARTGF